jgi:hypothetical protein
MKPSTLIVSLLIAFSASAQTGNTGVKWFTHTDTTYNLSIEYPSDWQLKPPTEKARFFVTSYPESDNDKFRENLNCLVPGDIEKEVTMKMVEDDIIKTLSESLPDFKIVQSNYSQWNKARAYEIEYTCTQKSNDITYDLHMLQKVAIIKGKFYGLTYTALSDSYEKYIRTVRRMFESFKVL